MASGLASMIMATQIHFNQMKYSVIKKRDRGVAECIYQNEVYKVDEKEKYEKSKLPESGYCTVEEYESASRAKAKNDIKVDEAKIVPDKNMVYVPQKTFKLVKYNDPVGSPELSLPRKLNFDRQINAQGIVSGDKTMLVYPTVYYYAQTDCTSCDLFLIKLDSQYNDVEKVMNANIIQREDTPLLSTAKEIDEKYIFRTLTPIDFSTDNKKLVIKEKIGHRFDGIWKTNLWVYDFETQTAQHLPQIRDAIVNYWAETNEINYDDKRWDIYPMGFDQNDDNRVIVCAYAYTGDVPRFLGTWSIDTEGNNAKLESLDGTNIPVSVVGYRLAEDSVKDASEVKFEQKQTKYLDKKEKDNIKKAEKFDQKVKKLEYQRKLQQMDMDTYIKIQQKREKAKELKKLNNKKTESATAEE